MAIRKCEILFTQPYRMSLRNTSRGELTINSEEIAVLESLGLSTIQAKAYLALTRLRRAKAGEIHKNAHVARQDVYRILEELQEIGIVERIVCRPIEYVAIPLEEGLTKLIERKHTEFGETKKRADKIKESVFSSNISEQKILSQDIIVTVDKELLASKTKKAFETAVQSIEYVSKWESFAHGSIETYEETRRAFRRGVKGRTVLELPKNPATFPKSIQKLIRDNSLEIKTIESIPFIALGIIDKKEVIFAPLQQGSKRAITYWSRNLGFVEMANNYFETMWEKANPLRLSGRR